MILFDFDGVLVDSAIEIAISAYNFHTGSEVIDPDGLPVGFLEIFRTNSHLIVAAHRLGAQARWCLEHLEKGGGVSSVISHADFDEYLRSIGGVKTDLAADFFKVRHWFMEAHPENWLAVNRPFEPLWTAVREMDQNKLAILTNKNRPAVLQIARHYELLLEPERIYSADGGSTKSQNVVVIDEKHRSESYVFLDDALENLHVLPKVLPGRITPVLAGWGYNSDEDKAAARHSKIAILSQKEFIGQYIR